MQRKQNPFRLTAILKQVFNPSCSWDRIKTLKMQRRLLLPQHWGRRRRGTQEHQGSPRLLRHHSWDVLNKSRWIWLVYPGARLLRRWGIYCGAAACRCNCWSSQNSAAIWVLLSLPLVPFKNGIKLSKNAFTLFWGNWPLTTKVGVLRIMTWNWGHFIDWNVLLKRRLCSTTEKHFCEQVFTSKLPEY